MTSHGHMGRAWVRPLLGRLAIVAMLIVAVDASVRPNGPASAATITHGGFTTSATVSATNVEPGDTINILARVTADATRTMLVDVELYGPTAIRLAQVVFDDEPFEAGVERTFPVSWVVPAQAATGGYTVKIGVFTPHFGQQRHWNESAGFFTVGMGTPPGPGGPVRIMPLGDSLTDGYNVEGGYRIDLWTMLAAQHSVDFVGSRYNGPPGLADKNHEGHSGWRIDELANGMTPWLSAYRPQIVLLMIGTNDLTQNYQVAGAPARLAALIDQVHSAVPDAAIVVSSVPRTSDAELTGRVQGYNAEIPGIVASKGSKVSYVDAFAAIDPSHLSADGVHLNHNGYGRLAQVWYPAVHAILTTPPPPTPTTVPSPTTIPPPVECRPRPRVLVSTAITGIGRLAATLATTGANNGLDELRVGDARNALIEVAGQSGRGNFTVPLPDAPTSVTLVVTRERTGEAVHVPLVAHDRCGDWRTFVGWGPTAF